jgi:hypothetical protein
MLPCITGRFLTVGEQADALRILRGVFQSEHPGSRVRRRAITQSLRLAPGAGFVAAELI